MAAGKPLIVGRFARVTAAGRWHNKLGEVLEAGRFMAHLEFQTGREATDGRSFQREWFKLDDVEQDERT